MKNTYSFRRPGLSLILVTGLLFVILAGATLVTVSHQRNAAKKTADTTLTQATATPAVSATTAATATPGATTATPTPAVTPQAVASFNPQAESDDIDSTIKDAKDSDYNSSTLSDQSFGF